MKSRRPYLLRAMHEWISDSNCTPHLVVDACVAGVEVPRRATIRWISNRARDLWPAAGSAIGELSWLAERELYAADGPSFAGRATVRALWTQARQGIRKHV